MAQARSDTPQTHRSTFHEAGASVSDFHPASSRTSPFIPLFLISLILLAAFALRLRGLALMLDMTHYDEAYYADDALSLIEQPRLQPFFEGNFGREGLWMYALTPALSVFGGSALALRITAIFAGLLTVAAVYRLAAEMIGRRGALYAAAALAVLYWHIQMSHIGFRALTMPLIGALAFAALWVALRRDRLRDWGVAGVWLGVLAYTYIAARAWIGLAGGILAVSLVLRLRANPRGRLGAKAQRRKGWRSLPGEIVAFAVALVVAAPLIAYLLTNPAAANQRIDQVAVTGVDQVIANFGAWLPVWFVQGPGDIVYNLPGRPLLDPPLALLAGCALAVGIYAILRAFFSSSNRLRVLVASSLPYVFILLLLAAALAPTLLTADPLRWLRAIGIVVPVSLGIGVGALALERLLRRVSIPLMLIPALLLAASGALALRDFDGWVGSPDLFQPMDQGLVRGIDRMAQSTPEDAPVYFAPFSLSHPVLRLRQHILGDRPVGAFIPVECVALTEAAPAYVFGLTVFTPGMIDRLSQFADVETVAGDDAAPPRWTISRVVMNQELLGGKWDDFGNLLSARTLDLPTDSAHPGDPFAVTMALRRLGEIDRAYTLFVHLYDESGGGIALKGQVDQPLCPSDPAAGWRLDEVVIQTFTLNIPTTVPPGDYTLAYGIYESPAGPRLPVGGSDFVRIGALRIN